MVSQLCKFFSLTSLFDLLDPQQYLAMMQGGVADEETMMNLAIALSLQDEVFVCQ